jgi:hypothetical protein
MGLEINVTRWVLSETETREICDTPVIGLSEVIPIGEKSCGTYFFRKMAEKRKEALKQERIKEGWEQHREENHLLNGNYDIIYSIQKISHKII